MKIKIEFLEPKNFNWWIIATLIGWLLFFIMLYCWFWFSDLEAKEIKWDNFTNEQIAKAIYLAEGGAKTKFPYGILTKYKHTTPRQACINTIRHARRDWNGKSDFIEFLSFRYCPIGAKNDPKRLNKNWVKNVKYWLRKGG